MVQWVAHIATLVRPIVDAMWRAMLATGYLQVDETSVRVLDPDVKGQAARGYLWFYAVPRGDVVLDFDRHRSLVPVQHRLHGPESSRWPATGFPIKTSHVRWESRGPPFNCGAHGFCLFGFRGLAS